MALTADANYNRRGGPAGGSEFGYAPSAGAVIYRGALLGMTAGGAVQPLQVSGSVAFAGLANQASNTPLQPEIEGYVVPLKGTWGLTVPGITLANIGSNLNLPVYATDDNTLTMTAGSNLQIGTLAGIDNGQTFVKLLGS